MRWALCFLLGLAVAVTAAAQPEPKMRKKKKNEDKEPPTQVLAVLPDPPPTITADAAHLTFQVSPLSNKGLLSQQTRDALKALMQMNRGASIVRLRAFVAGTGDMRRVQSIVSEVFADKKQPLPVLTTVQVGALPMTGAQVVMEAASVDRKALHANGVSFRAAVKGPDAGAVVSQLKAVGENSLAVTCLLNTLEDAAGLRNQLTAAFPAAAVNLMEAQRSGAGRGMVCQQVTEASANSRNGAARGRVVLSSIQMAFGREEQDIRLAFERMKKALGGANVVSANFYAMEAAVLQKLPEQGRAVFGGAEWSASLLEIEGLPSLDASFAMDVVAEGN